MTDPKIILAQRLQEELSDSYMAAALFVVVAFILGGIIAYCIYNIVKVVYFHKNQQRKFELQRRPAGNVSRPADDNEYYANADDGKSAEQLDDYGRFTKHINKAISQFKSYNEQLKKYYDENRPGEVPKDMVDMSIMNPNEDNY